MTQSRLNYAMILHTQTEALEIINPIDFASEFCRENDWRLNSCGTFSDNDIICQHSVKDASVATTNLGMFWFMVVCL